LSRAAAIARRRVLKLGLQRRHQSHAALVAWVKRHYRDRLTPGDLAYPALLDEGRRAVDELSRLLRIGNILSVPKSIKIMPGAPYGRPEWASVRAGTVGSADVSKSTSTRIVP
jgi:hypothetical protein